MIKETFFHTLPDDTKVKFTIIENSENSMIFFTAKVVNIELDFYQKMTQLERSGYWGVEICDIQGCTIKYKDALKFKEDILSHYGFECLKSTL